MEILANPKTTNILRIIIIVLLVIIIFRDNTAKAGLTNNQVIQVDIRAINGMPIYNNELPVKIKQ
jgi:hypothetical protein